MTTEQHEFDEWAWNSLCFQCQKPKSAHRSAATSTPADEDEVSLRLDHPSLHPIKGGVRTAADDALAEAVKALREIADRGSMPWQEFCKKWGYDLYVGGKASTVLASAALDRIDALNPTNDSGEQAAGGKG